MDFIIYTTITTIWWALSVTILLPLVIILKFCKALRDIWFTWMFVKIGGALRGPGLDRARKRAFDLLEKHLPKSKRGTPLEILEIGIGAGATLKFYPENSNLTVLEPNESMLKYFEETKKKHTHINYIKTVIGIAENMQEFDNDTFDIVVGTYVLCSVKNVRSSLKEIKRVLKPGGKYLFLEHIIFPGGNWKSMLQNITNPIWSTYYNGCHINKNHDDEIQKAEFSDVVMQRSFASDVWLYVRSQVTGIATK